MNTVQKYNRLKNFEAIPVNSYQIFMLRINIHIELYRRFGVFQMNLINCNFYWGDFDEEKIEQFIPDEINYMDELD